MPGRKKINQRTDRSSPMRDIAGLGLTHKARSSPLTTLRDIRPDGRSDAPRRILTSHDIPRGSPIDVSTVSSDAARTAHAGQPYNAPSGGHSLRYRNVGSN